jgi:acetate kinase
MGSTRSSLQPASANISAKVRADICHQLAFLGVELDVDTNAAATGDAELTAATSRVVVRVVSAREDVMIARGVRAALDVIV